VKLDKVYDDICEYQAIVRSPEEAPRIILKAIRIATNKKCVCRVELPADIAQMEAQGSEYIHKIFRSTSITIPEEDLLKKAVKLIDNATNVGIFAGAGCRNAREEVLELSEKIKAPITHTLRASDIFDHDTKNVVGLNGLIGNPSGFKAVTKCDLLLMLGTDFPYTDYLPKKIKTIQIDIRPENIGNRMPITLGLHGNIKETIKAITPICKPKSNTKFLDKLNQEFREWKESEKKEPESTNLKNSMHPQTVAGELNNKASKDAIFTIDTGTSAIWASNLISFHSDRRILGSFSHGSMAVGLPAAIGAQLQHPEKEVWAMLGDGAFNMTLHDFSTAVEYNLPIKVIVFNNSELGFVKIEMEEAGLAPNYDALEVKNFNFADFAKLCGGDGVKIHKAEDINAALEKAKKSKKPFIIDAVVNSGELSLPPGIDLDEAKNFGISKARELYKALNGDKKQWENIKNEIEAWFD